MEKIDISNKKLERFWAGVSVLFLWVFFVTLASIVIFLVFNKELTNFEQVQSGFKNLAMLCFGLSVFISYIFQLPTVLNKAYFKLLGLS